MKDCIFKKNLEWDKLSDEAFSCKLSESKFVLLTYNSNIERWIAGFPDPNDNDNLIWIKEKDLDVAKLKIAICSIES